MTQTLSQAIGVLQLPAAELSAWLLAEIEKNPLLEIEVLPPSYPADASRLAASETLFDHLMRQMREKFPDPQKRSEAVALMEQMDEKGFLPPSVESPLLPILQSFHPAGIFARDLRECLLLQLDPGCPAFQVVNLHFKDLLRGKFEAIKKKTGISDLAPALRSLARLHFRPADLFKSELNLPIVADLLISKWGKTWVVESNDVDLPKFHLRGDYLNLSLESAEERASFSQWVASGKSLLRSLKRRKSILLEVGVFLVRKQAAYLNGDGALQPLSMREAAQELGLHESTLSRALDGKYAETPRGSVPLRSLISSSSDPVKLALQKLISQEDRRHPLSDREIVIRLQKAGLKIARRTVSKYRSQLRIGTVSWRKNTRACP